MAHPPRILLAAGGTGGHLFPAEALAVELVKNGIEIHLATDARGMAYGGAFPATERHAIRAATPSGKSPLALAKAVLALGFGFVQSLRLIHRLKPDAVIGFGGYPSVPPVLAAWVLGVPALVHEQNGVLGRANRFLAGRVKVIATGFMDVKAVPDPVRFKMRLVGNPVRPAVLKAAEGAYQPIAPNGIIHLLVTGGSQGARIMSDVVPKALGLLPPDLKFRLSIVHQELGVIGRPSILVPLPGSLDQDQAANAASLAQIGAAIVMRQADFTAKALADQLEWLFTHPSELTDSSVAAKSAGIPDAAARLAFLVADVAGLSMKRSNGL